MKKYLYSVAIFLVLSMQLSAQLNPLPYSAQAIVFKKIFSYLKAFQKSENVRLLIVYDENGYKEKDELLAAFRNEKVNVTACHPEQLYNSIRDANVVYVTQNVAGNNIRHICRKNKKLSITGSPDLVSRGDASIGVGNAAKNEPGKKIKISPRIILNLTQLQNEAQEVTELLSLESIIKVK